MSVINAPWFSLTVGTTIGLAGIWLAIIFYRRTKQVTQLRQLIGHAPLIGSTPSRWSSGLEIRFEGKVVERVTSTSYGLWNDGTVTIHGRDIVQSDPLRLELTGTGEILRATVEATTRIVNGAAIASKDEKQAALSFDYLDPGDGFRVQIIHSGSVENIDVKGTIRGLPAGIKPLEPGRGIELFLKLLAVILALMMLGVIGMFAYALTGIVATQPWTKSLPLLLFGVLLVVVSVSGYRAGGKVTQTPSLPEIKGVPRVVTQDPILMGSPPSLLADAMESDTSSPDLDRQAR